MTMKIIKVNNKNDLSFLNERIIFRCIYSYKKKKKNDTFLYEDTRSKFESRIIIYAVIRI